MSKHSASKQAAKAVSVKPASKQHSTDLSIDVLERLRARMDALAPHELLSTRVDIAEAARRVLALLPSIKTNDALLVRLQALPSAEFDSTHLNTVEEAARVCLELVPRYRAATVQTSEAKLDAALVNDATQCKYRMLRTVKHYFEDDPMHGPEIADIQTGTGYADLSSDLKRLATLYENKKILEVIRHDPRFFDSTDTTRARALAATIDDQLYVGQSTQNKQLQADLARAWTLLGISYDQIRRTITFLLWGKVDQLAPFAPLFSFGRTSRRAGIAVTEASAIEASGVVVSPKTDASSV